MGVVQNEQAREEAPQQSQIPIKANYLLELNPCTCRSRLRVISMILFSVPILLVIALSVLNVLIIVFLIGFLVEIIFCPIFLIHLLEPLSAH